MKTVIVFESMFGNTEKFAREMRDTFTGTTDKATLADVRRVRPHDLAGCDLLIVGAPTHAFSMSKPATRGDAVRQGADPSRAVIGVREWLATLDQAFPTRTQRPVVAVFDTRVEKVRRLPGSAARRAARVLRAQGFTVLDRPTSFYVEALKGPAAAGERERARAWAGRVAGTVADLEAAGRQGTSP